MVPELCEAQNERGVPFINNYTTQDYNAFKQNWAITENEQGILFFGNGTGLVTFDGKYWESYHLPTSHITRSLARGQNGIIYAGAKGEFGYFETGQEGEISYVSLSERLEGRYTDFADVWEININSRNEVYFRSNEYLFTYSGDSLSVIESERTFGTSFFVGDQLIIRQKGRGLVTLQNEELIPVEGGELFKDLSVYFTIPYKNNSYLIGTGSNGFFIYDGKTFRPFETAMDEYLSKNTMYRGIRISDDLMAIATWTGGIVVLNNEGEVFQVVDESAGLLSNIVYDIYLDSTGQLWAALNTGISSISLLNPLTKFNELKGLPGIIGPVTRYNGTLFAGTHEGLFEMVTVHNDYPQQAFQAVDPQNTRILDLETVKGQLLIATTDGVFSWDSRKLEKVFENRVWDIYFDASVNTILMGGTGSIWKVAKSGPAWEFTLIDVPVENEIIEIESADGDFWARSDIGILYRIDTTSGSVIRTYKLFSDPEDLIFDLSDINGVPYLGTMRGLYKYSNETDEFKPDTLFDNRMEDSTYQVFRVKQANDGTVWIRSGRKFQEVEIGEEGWKIVEESRYNMIGEGESIETIFAESDGITWFGGTNGLYRYDPEWHENEPQTYNALIRKVLVNGDSLVFAGYRPQLESLGPVLPYHENEMRIQYSATTYESPGETIFQVWLEGFDTGWSNWTPEIQKDYTNIPEGSYVFRVRARDAYDRLSNVAEFKFTILPPWYRTIWAYLGYLLAIGGILYSVHRMRINRILREQRIRNRIASDLHDEISATLSSISYFAQAIRQSERGNTEERFVDLISESATEAKDKITDIIWSIDPENDDWVNLLSKCRRFASDLFESKNIDYDLDIDTDISRPLDVEMRQHLWLIFKEMATNAARHSGATRVDIIFKYGEGGLRLIVQDNGKGFDTEKVKAGNGLKNIYRRAEGINATITLESDPEIGTRWVMQVPL